MRSLRAVIAIIALAFAPAASALDYELLISNRFYAESISEDILYAQLRVPTATTALSERIAYQLHVLGTVRGRPIDALGLQLSLDTGLIELGKNGVSADGRELGARFKETLFLGETGLDLQFGETGVVELRAGVIRPNVGAGAIFDAYAFGATIDVDPSLIDPEHPWRYRVHALFPDATFTSRYKQSPLLAAEVGYAFAPEIELRLFGAIFVDAENGLEPILADALFRGRVFGAADRGERLDLGPIARRLVDQRIRARIREANELYNAGLIGYDLESSGYAAWTGLTGKLRSGELELRGALIFGFGQVDTTMSANEGLELYVRARFIEQVQAQLLSEELKQVSLVSYFANVDVRYALTETYAVDAFAIVMSGDAGLSEDPARAEDTYSSFIGLAPLLPFTSLFFRGGIAGSLASPVVASVAPDGAGLIAGGLGAELHPLDAMWVRVAGAAMFSTIESRASGSNAYGLEGDAAIELQATEFFTFSLQGAIFRPGAYFGDLPLSFQLIAGVHAQLP